MSLLCLRKLRSGSKYSGLLSIRNAPVESVALHQPIGRTSGADRHSSIVCALQVEGGYCNGGNMHEWDRNDWNVLPIQRTLITNREQNDQSDLRERKIF